MRVTLRAHHTRNFASAADAQMSSIVMLEHLRKPVEFPSRQAGGSPATAVAPHDADQDRAGGGPITGGMNFLTFVAATCFLLALPGPTNTLLATSGAGVGVSRSLYLLAAELAGYLLAIAVLRLALGPVVSDVPLVGAVLRVAVTVYVLCLAAMLWRFRASDLRSSAPVTFAQVLLATLLNPKAMVFAFLLLPLEAGLADLLPWLATIALQIVVAGAGWVTLGATLGRGARRLGHPDLITRTGAVTLVAVTGLIWLQAILSA